MPIPPIKAHIDKAHFAIWSKEDIKKISVKKITEPVSFEKLGNLSENGLYSRALGPVKRFEVCSTCGFNDLGCPGHYGHIELCVPVYHPMLIQTVYQVLSKCCFGCFHFRLSPLDLELFLAQLDALNYGFDHLIGELNDIAMDCRETKGDTNSYLHVALGKRLTARIQEEIERLKERTLETDTQDRPQQRSIVESLSKVFRTFMNGQLIKPLKLCPHCGAKKMSISLHRQAYIVVGTNSSKPADEIGLSSGREDSSRKAMKRKKAAKKIQDIEEEDLELRDLNYLKSNDKKFLTPIGARNCLRKLWYNEKGSLERIFRFLRSQDHLPPNEDNEKERDKEDLDGESKFHSVDVFFIDTILVPPPMFRPPMSQRGYSFEGPRTAALSSVMKQSIVVEDIVGQLTKEMDDSEAAKLHPKLQSQWHELQTCVNCVFDNEMDRFGKHKYPGLKQLIDKKEGLFRKNMMGKRVNFAARSVISPDPNIQVDQIGVPMVFAKKLSYPEPVTPWNIDSLRKAILNGPDVYPGAMSVVYDDGVTVSLVKKQVRQDIAARLSYQPKNNRFRRDNQDTPLTTIVNRHLLTGDVLLFNRQPTLHKPSIMAFRARVLPNEKGFRLHYANCKSFNADFDGDEMNAHLPQSELARSEAYNIASVNHQYLVPKDGSPLGGLIQDHVVAVCILTQRDQFFDKERYHEMVYCALASLGKPIRLEQPTIIRPAQLWTGKQVVTTVIKNCIPVGRPYPTLNIKSKISPKILNIQPKDEELSDCNVIIRNGELVTGYMDKSNVGATQYGLVHACYELYGGETSSNLMSAFARLATWYLKLYEGFTLGIGDILIEDDANQDRQEYIKESLTVGPDSAKEALNLKGEISEEKIEEKLREAHTDRDPLPMKKLDAAMKSRTDKIASSISSRCLPGGLIRRFPDNNLQMMIQSGAKGGTVNALQISCLLGQIELEGRRVPLSLSGRSLPSFKPYDTSPKAGGFVSGRFLTGIQPQEFFFHCMAGREGLIDTAVKTSRSGYLQRCLIKHLEGLTVHYDQTVRDSCGSVIQFLYGEDGLDITKCQMLKSKAFPLLVENYKTIKPSEEEWAKLNEAKEAYEAEVIERTNDIQMWIEKNGEDRFSKTRHSGFLRFLDTHCGGTADTSSTNESVVTKMEVTDDEINSSVNASFSDNPLKDGGSSKMAGSSNYAKFLEAWFALSFKERRKWIKMLELCPDPLIAAMNPASHFGVVPEKLDEIIEKFATSNPHLIVSSATLAGETATDDAFLEQDSMSGPATRRSMGASTVLDENPELCESILRHMNDESVTSIPNPIRPKMTKHEFYDLCYNLYMKMLAQPGEAVGLLAAQSIGEPSTQMTLNTFHFAGRGEMNVTLGIPRLREILMTASAKIGTPSMDLPLLRVMYDENGQELDEAAAEEQANRVKLALNAVRLSDILEYVTVSEQVVDGDEEEEIAAQGRAQRKQPKKAGKESAILKSMTNRRSIVYDIYFALLPRKYYKHEFKCSSAKAVKFIEEVFIDQLTDAMLKRQKRLQTAEQLFDVSTRGGAGKESLGSANDAGKEQSGASEDVEERELDEFNAKAKERRSARDDESSSDDEDEPDENEGDNTAAKLRSRRDQDLDYEEPEEDDLELGDGQEEQAAAREEEREDFEVIQEPEELDGDDNDATASGRPVKAEIVSPRKGRVQQQVEPDDEVGELDELAARARDEFEEEDKIEVERLAGRALELAGFDYDEEEEDDAEDDENATGEPSSKTGSSRRTGEPASKRTRLSRKSSASVSAAETPAKSKSSKRRNKYDAATVSERLNKVKAKPFVLDYEFDETRERWCRVKVRMNLATSRLDMGALLESEAKRTYVQRVGNIQRAFVVKDTNAKARGAICDKMIKTEGVSLLALVKFIHILDLNSIYSNDIHAIARTYGIEAASQAIRREMANVFAVYGIEVDARHLSLIADYMTYSGSIRGMNRMSMEASASPLQQMSFESTLRYLKGAAILGLYDDLKSPSAALVFGRPTRGGTGSFALMADNSSKAPQGQTSNGKSHDLSYEGWTN